MTEHVFFESYSPATFQEAERKDQSEPINARGELYIPQPVGKRRIPGVVVIEGLGGLKDERERAYGALFARRNYAALVVDSFGSRDASGLADEMRALLVTEAMMCADAFGALRFLRKHPNVDPDRICIIGFSYGGMISVLTAYAQVHDLFASREEVFAGHIAFYGCSVIRLEKTGTTGNPVLIVLGEKDENVSIERTREIADDLRRGGSEVFLDVLKGAYHQWDGGDLKRRFVRFTLKNIKALLGANNEAWEEGSGWRLKGRLSRALLLLLRADPSGYYILDDKDMTKVSNRKMFSFLKYANRRAARRGAN
jgi:dienelactone hydrolase